MCHVFWLWFSVDAHTFTFRVFGYCLMSYLVCLIGLHSYADPAKSQTHSGTSEHIIGLDQDNVHTSKAMKRMCVSCASNGWYFASFRCCLRNCTPAIKRMRVTTRNIASWKKMPRYRRDHRAMRPIYECPKNNLSAKSPADCARISTLQSYHYSAVKLFSKYSNQCDHGT